MAENSAMIKMAAEHPFTGRKLLLVKIPFRHRKSRAKQNQVVVRVRANVNGWILLLLDGGRVVTPPPSD